MGRWERSSGASLLYLPLCDRYQLWVWPKGTLGRKKPSQPALTPSIGPGQQDSETFISVRLRFYFETWPLSAWAGFKLIV